MQVFEKMDLRDQILKSAEAKLSSPCHFVVDVIVSKHKPAKITVVLDGDEGITIDDCSKISRALSAQMDEENWVRDDNYTLEVGTPGLDHPLKLVRQYRKNVGRGFVVHTGNKQRLQGQLLSADDAKITLAMEVKEGKKTVTKQIDIPYLEIEKAFVTVSFKK
jgi:ribosome maturation factor RimP